MAFEEELIDGRAGSGPRPPATLRVPCALEVRRLHSPSAGPLSVREPPALPPASDHQSPTPPAQLLLSRPTGLKSMVVGSKGCSEGRMQDAPTITIHSGPPGVLVASYAHFCSSNRCNRASNTSVLLTSLPPPGMEAQRVGWDRGHREIGRHRDSGDRGGWLQLGAELCTPTSSLLFSCPCPRKFAVSRLCEHLWILPRKPRECYVPQWHDSLLQRLH